MLYTGPCSFEYDRTNGTRKQAKTKAFGHSSLQPLAESQAVLLSSVIFDASRMLRNYGRIDLYHYGQVKEWFISAKGFRSLIPFIIESTTRLEGLIRFDVGRMTVKKYSIGDGILSSAVQMYQQEVPRLVRDRPLADDETLAIIV
jgi:hypothetical protein